MCGKAELTPAAIRITITENEQQEPDMGSLSWRFDERELALVKDVLESGFVSAAAGGMNGRLEDSFARRIGRQFGVTFNSGTTTLHAALLALGAGFGDEVLVPAVTVVSCANAVLYCRAVPVFVDIDPDTFLMDPDDLERKITPRTKAVMPVHLYGQVCDMSRILETADRRGLTVLEDCAQCFLGTHRGKIAGSMGHAGSWSFENSKHMTTGDGGIVACDDEALARKIRQLGSQGYRNVSAQNGKIRLSKEQFQDPGYKRHEILGYMYRLPEVAAALGIAQLEKLDRFLELREKMAALYLEVLSDTRCGFLAPQKKPEGDRHVYWSFAVKYSHPDVPWKTFRKRYTENGGDGIYAAWSLYYQEGHIQDVTAYLDSMGLAGRLNTREGQCPEAERIQPKIMQFTTNQKNSEEMEVQAEALRRTILDFT